MNEFLAAVAGAVIGSVVGGIIAYFLQRQNLLEARQQRKEDAEARQKALGQSLVFKMMRIYSHLRVFNLHVGGALAAAQKAGFVGQPWQIVLPIVNSPDAVHFSTDEMVLLLALKDNELFNDLAAMDERHNGTIASFEVYAKHRLELGALMPAEMKGNVGTAYLSSDQRRVCEPKMVELNSLIAALMPQCQAQEREAWDVLSRLTALLSSKIGLTLKLEQKQDDELVATTEP